LAGLGGAFAVAAAGWTLGNRQVGAPVAAVPAATMPAAATASSPNIATTSSPPSVDTSLPATAPAPAEPGTAASAARIKPKDKLAAHVGDGALPPVPPHTGIAAAPLTPAPAAAAVSTEPAPATPREACGSRVFLALALCMEEQCDKPRFKSHPQCEKVRELIERRHRGESG